MKLKKFDLSVIKDFLFLKGERVALAICGLFAIILLGVGLMKAGGSTTYAKDLAEARKNKDKLINASNPIEDDKAPPPAKADPDPWPFIPVAFDPTPLIQQPDAQDNKRRNPTIRKILDDEKHIQVDVLRGGYLSYELNTFKETAGTYGGVNKALAAPQPRERGIGAGAGGGQRMVKIMKYGRMVVVTAVFPMRDQLEDYRQKLRLDFVGEVLANPELQPQALGLNVYRCELNPDAKPTDKPPQWKHLYKYDPIKDKFEVDERLKGLYREAWIDEDNPSWFGDHLQRGMITPVPLLANLQYPKVNLQDIKVLEAEDPEKPQPKGFVPLQNKRPSVNMPGGLRKDNAEAGGGGAAAVAAGDPDANWVSVAWKNLPRDLYEKFTAKGIDYFDPSGILPDRFDPNFPGGVNPGMPRQPPGDGPRPFREPPGDGPRPFRPGPGAAPLAGGDRAELAVDSVVRFVDIDVEPGKTYLYSFQVRFANPNYKRNKEVAFQALADIKELVSPFSYSPPVTIPDEYFVYAVDQMPETYIVGGSDPSNKLATSEPAIPYGKWTTAIQIHRWMPKFTDSFGTDWTVADWAIAERLLVRRGDTIGRYSVIVQVPVWKKDHEAFEIGYQPQKVDPKKKGVKVHTYTGLPIDFIKDAIPPLLVDFEGGWKVQPKVGAVPVPKDESAVELLILTPEGKLVVRNSRHDTDPEYPGAAERHARWQNWISSLRQLRNSAGQGGPGGPGGPGNAIPGGGRGS